MGVSTLRSDVLRNKILYTPVIGASVLSIIIVMFEHSSRLLVPGLVWPACGTKRTCIPKRSVVEWQRVKC